MNDIHVISNSFIDAPRYGSKQFASPMKELREQTILTENREENKNDSYRQKTKYDDRVDSYFSTYDLGILLHNDDSYLEGKLDTGKDVDYYSFFYGQRSFYEKMGIGTEVTIRLEHIPEGCDYDLVVYDMQGNQIGIAKDTANGNKELTLPDWGSKSNRYTIKVEHHGGKKADNAGTEGSYRIRITEEKYQKQEKENGKQDYDSEIERLHREQYHSLPEEERYTGTKSVEELLKKKASGEILDGKEEVYLNIFANLHEYERAAAYGSIKNTLYPKMQEALEAAGIHMQGKEYAIEMDICGNIKIVGDFSEEEKQAAEDVLKKQFSEELWDCHMRASDYTTEEFNRINAYKELSVFLRKSTGGGYSWKDISVDRNGKIGGLPEKMCRLLNSQESNGKYEQLRDDILMLYDYQREHGMDALLGYKVRYEITGSDITFPLQKELSVI